MRTLRLLSVFFLTLAMSCGASTSGDRFQIPFAAGGMEREVTQPLSFTTPLGWVVTLKTAKIALGPFYFKESEASQNDPNDLAAIVQTNAQVTRQVVVDALDPKLNAVPGGVEGRSGRSLAVEIGLLPPDATVSDDDLQLLKQGFAFVAGSAVKDGTTIEFSGRMVIDQSFATPQEPLAEVRKVKSAVVDLDFGSNEQGLTLRVDPSLWFVRTDFSVLTDKLSDGVTFTWAKDSTFHAQLLEGAKSSSGIYNFALVQRQEDSKK
jgi:hypothetical protein